MSDRTSLVKELLVPQSQQPVWDDRTWVMPNTGRSQLSNPSDLSCFLVWQLRPICQNVTLPKSAISDPAILVAHFQNINRSHDSFWVQYVLWIVLTQSTIPTFGNRCLAAIGGGKQWSSLAGWVQLSAEAAPGPRGVPPAPPCVRRGFRSCRWEW